MRILVTGGAGFIGSNIALFFARRDSGNRIVAVDNLKRRGSELALPRLAAAGVRFVHGDVRNPEDLEVGAIDAIIDCAAEPAVGAGTDEDPRYVIGSNLVGTLHTLERARRDRAAFVFLSTSRVYPIEPLRALPLIKGNERFALVEGASGPGWSAEGINEDFPLAGHRSVYGATKLASELMIQEYVHSFGLKAVINRCGVVAGPWQMGRVEQGFLALWMARHLYGGDLSYLGFGGTGSQVRDILHIDDLCDLIALQLGSIERHSGACFSVGGGPRSNVSLRELTAMCAAATGRQKQIGSVERTHPVDIPYFVTDCRRVCHATGWQPTRSLEQLLGDVHRWLVDNHGLLPAYFS